MNKAKRQLLPLTGMRFFLALWVVLFHQSFFYGPSWISPLPNSIVDLIHAGYMAVGMFFVLSGFVLSYNYNLDNLWPQGQIKRFAFARFARIYPAYGIGLILSLPWVVTSMAHQPIVAAGRELIRAVLSWTLLQAWVPWAAESWNGPGWSLSVEAFFYCCFPFVGVALWKLSRPRHILSVSATIWAASIVVPAIAFAVPFTDGGGIRASLWTSDTTGLRVSFAKFNPLLHLPEFCMGILIGRAYLLLLVRETRLLGKGYWIYLPGIAFEILAVISCRSSLYLFLHNGLLLPLHAMVVLGLALDGGILARFCSIGPLVLLGNASYSMYIFQAPVAGYVFSLGKRMSSLQSSGILMNSLYIAILICFSTLIFKFIEDPANRILKKKLMPSFQSSTSHERDALVPPAKAAPLRAPV